MKRIVLTLSYDGTDFCGWQVQPEKRTVQGTLERALSGLTGETVSVTGSGRTDSGVHAAAQVAHFDTRSAIPPERFAPALNAVLPADVSVLSSREGEEGFHARFSAKEKTYRYAAYLSPVELPLKNRYAVRIDPRTDVSRMAEAAEYLVGTHDFSCFLASNSSVKNTVRTVYESRVFRRGEDVFFVIRGNGFLYNMVRIAAGTLLRVGEGKIPPEAVKEVLEKKDRSLAGITMPPQGLTLLSVEYGSPAPGKEDENGDDPQKSP